MTRIPMEEKVKQAAEVVCRQGMIRFPSPTRPWPSSPPWSMETRRSWT